jgi:hypothetical protein
MTDDHPDVPELARLARLGRAELARLDRRRDAELWAGVEEGLPAVESAVTRSSWRDRAALWPLSVAAAVALVVGLAVGGLLGRTADPAPATLATIRLDPLVEGASPATAALQQGAAGRTISLSLTDLPATDGFHEVWLLDPATGALVSLGPVRSDGTYVVPDTVDLVELPVVDVSREPGDGDPSHSGDSILRGTVTWVG